MLIRNTSVWYGNRIIANRYNFYLETNFLSGSEFDFFKPIPKNTPIVSE